MFSEQQDPPFHYFQESLSSGSTLQSPLYQNPIGGSWESWFPIPGANAPSSSYQHFKSNSSALTEDTYRRFNSSSLLGRLQHFHPQNPSNESLAPSSNIENDMIELLLSSSQFIDPAQKNMPPIEMHEAPLMHPVVGRQISGSEEPLNQQWRETGESSQTIAQQVTSPGEADSYMLEALETMLNPVHLQTTFAESSQKPLHYQDSPDDAGNILHNRTLTQIDTDSSMPQETSPLLATLGHQIGALEEPFDPNSFLRNPESPEMLQLPAQRVASHPAPYHWMDAPELSRTCRPTVQEISLSRRLSLCEIT